MVLDPITVADHVLIGPRDTLVTALSDDEWRQWEDRMVHWPAWNAEAATAGA